MLSMNLQLFAITLVLYMPLRLADGFLYDSVSSMKTELLKHYSKTTTPLHVEDEEFNIPVQFWIWIESIGDLDEQSEKLTTTLRVESIWMDEVVRAYQNKYHYYVINMDESQMWVPKLQLHNQHHHAKERQLEVYSMPVIYSDGTAFFSQVITAETACDLNSRDFPFDEHKCSIDFVVNKWQVDVEVSLKQKDFLLHSFQPDGSWNVVDADITESKGDTHIYQTSSIHLHITFRRKASFVMVNLVIPIAVLAMLSPMVFLLPNKPGERLGYSVTLLLALSVYMTIISDQVPNKSDPMPLIMVLMLALYIIMASVVAIVIINAKLHKLPNTVRIPKFCKILLLHTECICCCLRRSAKLKYDVENDDHVIPSHNVLESIEDKAGILESALKKYSCCKVETEAEVSEECTAPDEKMETEQNQSGVDKSPTPTGPQEREKREEQAITSDKSQNVLECSEDKGGKLESALKNKFSSCEVEAETEISEDEKIEIDVNQTGADKSPTPAGPQENGEREERPVSDTEDGGQKCQNIKKIFMDVPKRIRCFRGGKTKSYILQDTATDLETGQDKVKGRREIEWKDITWSLDMLFFTSYIFGEILLLSIWVADLRAK